MYRIRKHCVAIFLLLLAAVVATSSAPNSAQAQSAAPVKVLARGGGKTIVQGGTGQPGFVPVVTTLAFHAERKGQVIFGGFECLALVPAVATGNGSGQFTVNAMYVTGQITGVDIGDGTATLKGTATITGLGEGSNVPFSFVVQRGGPGSTATLTTEGPPHLVFNEILLEGAFEISDRD